MASAAADSGKRLALELTAPTMWLAVWLPIGMVTVLHYGTGHETMWAHGILRRVYYLPIILAAFRSGLAGGLAAAIVTTVAYVPHAFTDAHHHRDPAPTVEKVLEILLYHVVGGLAGYLTALEKRRRLELQRALEDQRQLTNQLARAGRLGALGQLVAGIAHEIKNPLHALQGTAEIVDNVVPAECPERRMWEIHRKELSRLGDIAGRFLSFARPNDPELAAIDLRDVGKHIVTLIDAEARRHHVGVTLEVRPEVHPKVLGDRDQLTQIGINVVVNAIRALKDRPNGRIHVTVGARTIRDRLHAVLSIENDGPPIPDDALETLFNPFFSGHDEGTGLGLAISSRIAEQHGGWIEAENAGLGVRFTLFVPQIDSQLER